MRASLIRLLLLWLLSLACLQVWFAARIALMNVLPPQSTAFQRSEILRLAVQKHQIAWSQEWVDNAALSPQLKRAVIASEDADFVEHGGIEWEAVEKAWDKNQAAEARAQKQQARSAKPVRVKISGGSTISQQLAKNLFLSGERHMPRKMQEALITLMLETLLSKQRILEIYLNSVEWGEGVFGAQAAARHYFRVDAKALSASQAARLAVLLPAPKLYGLNPGSGFVLGHAGTIEARMPAVELP